MIGFGWSVPGAARLTPVSRGCASWLRTWLATLVICVGAALPGQAQSNTVVAVTLTPRSQRLSDEVIARDLQQLDARSRAAQQLGDHRGAMYIDLARDAYERNDDGALSALLLAAAAGTAPVPRAMRDDLWAVADSARATPLAGDSAQADAAALEAALVRAQYPLLGAPSCAAWEREADRLAALVRLRRRAAMVAVTPPPADPVVPDLPATRPLAPLTLTELGGVPSVVNFAVDRDQLSPRSRNVLAALVDSLRYARTVKIVLEPYRDPSAGVNAMLPISRRRAMSVQAYLELLGIDGSRISIATQGTSQLSESDSDALAPARKRRVRLRYFTADGVELRVTQLLDDLPPDPARPRRAQPRVP
jgi:outer membrane protein OmpA-like peptidoglycan-associated protein